MSSEFPSSELPQLDGIRTSRFVATFKSTTNSYKYFWALALIDLVESGRGPILSTSECCGLMVAKAWTPAVFFGLSFGRQDQLAQICQDLRQGERTQPAAYARQLRDKALQGELSDAAGHLARYVPYRFLSPWFRPELSSMVDSRRDAAIVALAEARFNAPSDPPVYRFLADISSLEVQPSWHAYIGEHAAVLRGYVERRMLEFLQRRNPTAYNITKKLTVPTTRNLGRPRRVWDRLIRSWPSPGYTCPYSESAVDADAFTLDHVLPWTFVAHDAMWNLVPVPISVNSSKGDQLPSDAMLRRVAHTLWQARTMVSDRATISVDLEAFVGTASDNTESEFAASYLHAIRPLADMARRQGFGSDWSP